MRRRCPASWRLPAVAGLAAVVLVACVGTSDVDVAVSSPSTDATSTAPTTTAPTLAGCASQLSPEAQAAEMLMALVGDPDEAGDLVAAGQVGSYALKGEQSQAVGAQVQSTDARAPGPRPILVASDEEGGTVQRLRAVLGREPSAADVAATLTPEQAGERAEDYARRMAALGFDMVLAPVVDVGEGSGLGSRSYGDDPEVVAGYGVAVAEGIRRAGLLPVAKHWPGLGRGGADPHDARTEVPPLEELRTRDLRPFGEMVDAGVEAIMVSHATVPGLTGELPASRSPDAITGELRGRQGFEGLVITDSLGMGASLVGTTQPAAAEAAIRAGADVAMVSGAADAAAAHAQLVDAVRTGRIPAEQVSASVGRVLAVKGVSPLSCQVA